MTKAELVTKTCKNCGASEYEQKGSNVCECAYCRTKYPVETASPPLRLDYPYNWEGKAEKGSLAEGLANVLGSIGGLINF